MNLKYIKIYRDKILLTLALGLGINITVLAQIQGDPAHWAYAVKHVTGNIYEIHLRASIDDPWHIYAQKQGKYFVGTATNIKFTSQQGLHLLGQTLEQGKKILYLNKEVSISNYEYSGTVDFVQKVSFERRLKSITGTIKYQTCTDEHCLLAQTINFNIPITD